MPMQTNILRWAASAASALGAWALLMLALPFVGPPGRQVAVVGDKAGAFRTIAAAGGQIVEVRGVAVLARSDRPGFARRLYRAGAPLVIEGRIAAGCFSKAAS
jgi:hypothetical protein